MIEKKLLKYLNEAEIVADLVAAGLTTPALIRAASQNTLTAAVGADNVSVVVVAFAVSVR